MNQKYTFYVDVGDLSPQETLARFNRVKEQFKKARILGTKEDQ